MSDDDLKAAVRGLVDQTLVETVRRLADQALVEVEALQKHAKRLQGAIKALVVCHDAGVQLPADLMTRLSKALDDLHLDLAAAETLA